MGNESRRNPLAFDSTSPLEPTTLDARGRVLEEGDELILNTRGPIYFRVAKIEPLASLDPAARTMVLVHIGCMLTFTAKRGAVNAEFIRVRTGEEAGPTEFKLLDAVDQHKPGVDS